MTLDKMLSDYINAHIRTYIAANLDDILSEYFAQHNLNTSEMSTEQMHGIISEFLSDNDYMTRDDVKEEINGADVRIESAYLSA